MFKAIEFFAGSGLVRLGLEKQFETVWANDNCPKKRDTYIANHGSGEFVLTDVRQVAGKNIPRADLAWASFPCQDLSLAGNLSGMAEGTRSGLFWEWIRVLWELRKEGKLPPILVAENVVGFVVSEGGRHFKKAHAALRELGYRVGAVQIDANAFVPQSRPRAFIIAVRDGIALGDLCQPHPTSPFHSAGLTKTALLLDDPKWIWWSLPQPKRRELLFSDICEWNAPCHLPEKTNSLLEKLSETNRKKLNAVLELRSRFAGTAYLRTRPDAVGVKVQRFEIRFDETAGCLRTPRGGSSRQTVIIVENGQVRSRLMTVRECARLMGAPDSYKLVGTYNDGYAAMGDAVAVPATSWLSAHILAPILNMVNSPFYSIPRTDTPVWMANKAIQGDGASLHG